MATQTGIFKRHSRIAEMLYEGEIVRHVGKSPRNFLVILTLIAAVVIGFKSAILAASLLLFAAVMLIYDRIEEVVVTESRVILVSGTFFPEVQTIDVWGIDTIAVEHTFVQRAFGVGTFVIGLIDGTVVNVPEVYDVEILAEAIRACAGLKNTVYYSEN